MHGLPADFDCSIFVGLELESVTFASNAVHLAFGADVSLTSINHLRYRASADSDLRDDVLPVRQSGLMAMIGQRVEGAKAKGPGDLILQLESGGVIWFADDSEHYESYSVRTPRGEVFV